MRGEMGYASALTAPRWGFQDVVLQGKEIVLAQPLACYTMENILFKVAFPAEFHAQTAAEAALQLHAIVRDRLEEIDRIEVHTQESAVRIIDKTGPLLNPADRDHCLQYIIAVSLIYGSLEARHYEAETAQDPRIDALRQKMTVREDPKFTRDYLDPALRSIGNRVQIFFRDGTSTPAIEKEFPIGHRRRRSEAFPLLIDKFQQNTRSSLSDAQRSSILALWQDASTLLATRVSHWMDRFAPTA
jgi:2-methylcitrate dehydratase